MLFSGFYNRESHAERTQGLEVGQFLSVSHVTCIRELLCRFTYDREEPIKVSDKEFYKKNKKIYLYYIYLYYLSIL